MLDLPVAQGFDRGIDSRSLNAAVPASVVIGSVAVGFAVRLVVLHGVGNQIVEGKSVMACPEIYTHLGLPFLRPRNLRAAKKPPRYLRHRSFVSSKETSDVLPTPPGPPS